MWIMTIATLACLSPLFEAGTVPAESSGPNLQDDSRETCDVVAPVTLTSTQRTAIVDKHNALRHNVAQVDGKAYKFKDMEWDADLAGKAQMAANTCQLRHSYHRHYCPITKNYDAYSGQNTLRHFYTSADASQIDFVQEVQYWWDEVHSYNYTEQSCQTGRICRHYLQMAWEKTFKVGCAYRFCEKAWADYDFDTEQFDRVENNMFFFVCNYYPAYRNPDYVHRPEEARPYDTSCMATAVEKACHSRGQYNEAKCQCDCNAGFAGKWCEFESACKDSDQDCERMKGWCGDSAFGDVMAGLCPKTCGTC